MGTNFYWKTNIPATVRTVAGAELDVSFDMDDPQVHIGKRSAAGAYCWDCKRTLCAGGESRVHHGDPMLEACPGCGKRPDKRGWATTGGVELGFAKPEDVVRKGVGSCSSFGWAQDPVKVRKICLDHRNVAVVVDEYDRDYTGAEFLKLLEWCPIQNMYIGERFS